MKERRGLAAKGIMEMPRKLLVILFALSKKTLSALLALLF